ncbi:hypothetical protein [Clostridioides difficile]|uniref:hypothetical protein n=1 Tax=Clostridioides difficile TaxID=1496 RepID=UPI00038C7AF2|nr:hypothetical protein [Clostridioides difficile]EGT3815283.1 hypothetical protein [Clostridioides difficile]EGT4202990.1 hypothetical protein [Clostridioides difficile]ELX4570432.1 hypothetical protein [Clostridioides difficile]EQJ94796.1 hypothetical protein QUA_0951 [Clostridioides difficile P49]MBY1421624.1 hypothetical protein [Clostridioides difficile]
MAKSKVDERKKLVEQILLSEGKNYDEWLNEVHNNFIMQNVNLLRSGLDKLNQENRNGGDL